jgi:hypothetical protein
LNPYAPDLRKSAIREGGDALAIAISAGQVMIAMCPRTDTHLTYMINITLTMEFALAAGGAR